MIQWPAIGDSEVIHGISTRSASGSDYDYSQLTGNTEVIRINCWQDDLRMHRGSALTDILTRSQARARCGFFFATVALFRTGFLEDLASDFFDSTWAKLRRICSIKSGTPVTCLWGAGNV